MTVKKGSNKNDNLKGTNGDDVLLGFGGNDILVGGKGDDDLMGGDGNDTFVAQSDGSDAYDGGKGIDKLSYATASAAIELRFAYAGSGYTYKSIDQDVFYNIENFIGSKYGDYILVLAKNAADYAFGGKGNDQVFVYGGVARGDDGLDQLFGNPSTADTFWLQRNKGEDTVSNFNSGQDKIRLDGDEFDLGVLLNVNEYIPSPVGVQPFGTKPQLVYDFGADKLYYDKDGTGSAPAELIASFAGNVIPSLMDFEIV